MMISRCPAANAHLNLEARHTAHACSPLAVC
jgi:hypothetical protein